MKTQQCVPIRKLVEHRESCEVCRKEDLAIKEGDLPMQLEAGII